MALLVRNETRRSVLAHNVERASSFWKRFKGLLGRKNLPEGHGLWIERCKSIHTHFMRFSIDVVFVDREKRVVRVFKDIRPFRLTPYLRQANDCLELPAGTIGRNRTAVGDQLRVEASN